MAKKQVVDKNIKEIRNSLEQKRAILGSDETLKNLKIGKIEKVFISENCTDVEEIDRLCKLAKIPLVHLTYPNDELGVLAKQPFSISVIGVHPRTHPGDSWSIVRILYV